IVLVWQSDPSVGLAQRLAGLATQLSPSGVLKVCLSSFDDSAVQAYRPSVLVDADVLTEGAGQRPPIRIAEARGVPLTAWRGAVQQALMVEARSTRGGVTLSLIARLPLAAFLILASMVQNRLALAGTDIAGRSVCSSLVVTFACNVIEATSKTVERE